MSELLRTNDAVLLSFAQALLNDAGIGNFMADFNMSIFEGSIGLLPRRIMVETERLAEARQLLADAGLAGELRDP